MRLISFGLVGGLLFIGSAEAETLERTVKANMRTPLGGFSIYNIGTCYAGPVVDGTIEQQAVNGTIELQVTDWTIPKGQQCEGAKVRGAVIVYTPKKGFKGADEGVVSFPFSPSDGPAQGLNSYKFRIKVE
jgi:hypothetical protein